MLKLLVSLFCIASVLGNGVILTTENILMLESRNVSCVDLRMRQADGLLLIPPHSLRSKKATTFGDFEGVCVDSFGQEVFLRTYRKKVACWLQDEKGFWNESVSTDCDQCIDEDMCQISSTTTKRFGIRTKNRFVIHGVQPGRYVLISEPKAKKVSALASMSQDDVFPGCQCPTVRCMAMNQGGCDIHNVTMTKGGKVGIQVYNILSETTTTTYDSNDTQHVYKVVDLLPDLMTITFTPSGLLKFIADSLLVGFLIIVAIWILSMFFSLMVNAHKSIKLFVTAIGSIWRVLRWLIRMPARFLKYVFLRLKHRRQTSSKMTKQQSINLSSMMLTFMMVTGGCQVFSDVSNKCDDVFYLSSSSAPVFRLDRTVSGFLSDSHTICLFLYDNDSGEVVRTFLRVAITTSVCLPVLRVDKISTDTAVMASSWCTCPYAPINDQCDDLEEAFSSKVHMTLAECQTVIRSTSPPGLIPEKFCDTLDYNSSSYVYTSKPGSASTSCFASNTDTTVCTLSKLKCGAMNALKIKLNVLETSSHIMSVYTVSSHNALLVGRWSLSSAKTSFDLFEYLNTTVAALFNSYGLNITGGRFGVSLQINTPPIYIDSSVVVIAEPLSELVVGTYVVSSLRTVKFGLSKSLNARPYQFMKCRKFDTTHSLIPTSVITAQPLESGVDFDFTGNLNCDSNRVTYDVLTREYAAWLNDFKSFNAFYSTRMYSPLLADAGAEATLEGTTTDPYISFCYGMGDRSSTYAMTVSINMAPTDHLYRVCPFAYSTSDVIYTLTGQNPMILDSDVEVNVDVGLPFLIAAEFVYSGALKNDEVRGDGLYSLSGEVVVDVVCEKCNTMSQKFSIIGSSKTSTLFVTTQDSTSLCFKPRSPQFCVSKISLTPSCFIIRSHPVKTDEEFTVAQVKSALGISTSTVTPPSNFGWVGDIFNWVGDVFKVFGSTVSDFFTSGYNAVWYLQVGWYILVVGVPIVMVISSSVLLYKKIFTKVYIKAS